MVSERGPTPSNDDVGARLLGQADDVALGIGDQRELGRAVRAELRHDDAPPRSLTLASVESMSATRTSRSRGRSSRPACCRCRRPARSWRDRSSRSRPDCWCRAPSRTARCSSAGAPSVLADDLEMDDSCLCHRSVSCFGTSVMVASVALTNQRRTASARNRQARTDDQSSRTKVTIMLTWYSAILPSRMSTRCSLIQAPRTFGASCWRERRPCGRRPRSSSATWN